LHRNLRTEHLLAANMGLEGEGVSFPDFLQAADCKIPRRLLAMPIRTLVNAARLSLFADPRQTLTTFLTLLLYAAFEEALHTQPFQSSVREARVRNVIWTASVLLLCWINVLSARMRREPVEIMELYVRSFSEAVRGLRVPPALRGQVCTDASEADGDAPLPGSQELGEVDAPMPA
jgi:hypothetical protein